MAYQNTSTISGAALSFEGHFSGSATPVNMEAPVCLICYEAVGEPVSVRCCNAKCIGVTCVECVKQYIASVSPDGSPLKCPRLECTGIIDMESLRGKRGLSKDDMEMYYAGLLKHVLSSENDVVKQQRAQALAVEQVRQARQKFYDTFLPPAVQTIANLAFAKRKSRIDPKMVERKEKAVKSTAQRMCLNQFCKGLLDGTYQCGLCETTFCKECENPKSQGGQHVCNEKDKESLAFIKKLTACPKCGVRVEKGEGCLAITCAVCRTNFMYHTGQQGGGGNHGQSKPVLLETAFIPPSKAFAGQLRGEALREVLAFEETVVSDHAKQLHDRVVRFAVAAEADKARRKPFAEAYSVFVRQKNKFQEAMKSLLFISRVLSADKHLVISDNLSDVAKAFKPEEKPTPSAKRKAMEEEEEEEEEEKEEKKSRVEEEEELRLVFID